MGPVTCKVSHDQSVGHVGTRPSEGRRPTRPQKAAGMREVFKTAQPIPRAGIPDDIAQAAAFLASDQASFINGSDLVIDGGAIGGRNWTQQQQGYVQLRKMFGQTVD